MTITKTLLLAAVLAATLNACACERSPGQDVRLVGYDNLYPAYTIE